MDTLFTALVCRLQTADCTQDGSALRLVGGKEGGSKQAVAVVGKQVPSFKCQVQEDWSGFKNMSKFTVPPSRPRRQINGALYIPGGNVCNRRYTLFLPQESSDTYNTNVYPGALEFAFRLVSSCIVRKGYICFAKYLDT